MKKLILSALIGILPSTLLAHSRITDFTVFSKTNIDYARSDFEGRVGAGENISVTDFLFAIGDYSGVLAGNNFKQNRGTINSSPLQAGGIVNLSIVQANVDTTSTDVKLNYSTITGTTSSNSLSITTHLDNFPTSEIRTYKKLSAETAESERIELRNYLSGLSQQMDDLSFACKNLHGKKPSAVRGVLHLEGYSSLNVFNVTGAEIKHVNEIVFNVNPLATTVINISGNDVEFVLKGIKLVNADPRKIIWNIHEAQTLRLHKSGSSQLLAGREIGLPGTFIAPNALVDFTEAVITGSIFVKDLDGNKDGENGGQVNYGPFNGNPCVRRTGGK